MGVQNPKTVETTTHLANGPWKKKFELYFPYIHMESPKVQKVSHWLSKTN